MLSQSQVGSILDVGRATLNHYVKACGAELSHQCRLTNGQRFTEDDVAVLRRMQARLARQNELRVSCAWCGKDLGARPGGGVSGLSHGMCGHCAETFLHQYELERATSAAG